ncbi:MAG: hypothetical protein ABL923_07670 [Burkholderiaceae bacterium]
MNTYLAALPSWSTTALSFNVNAVPNIVNDASALCKHLDHCKVTNKRIFAMHCAAEVMHGFVMGRFITTLVVVFVLIGGYFIAI